MNRSPAFTWRDVLCRYQVWVAAGFVVAATWAIQDLFDEHLHRADGGFGAGYLHFLRRLDHFFVFVAGGLLMASRGAFARYAFPIICAGVVLIGWLMRDLNWPWAAISMLWLLLFLAMLLAWAHLRPLTFAAACFILGSLFLAHLASECEFGTPTEDRGPEFAAGLALSAFLSSAAGVALGAPTAAEAARWKVAASVLLLSVALALAIAG